MKGLNRRIQLLQPCMYDVSSLVPRPFPPPVFDRLQYKNGGEGLGERVTCVTSGRCEGGGARSL